MSDSLARRLSPLVLLLATFGCDKLPKIEGLTPGAPAASAPAEPAPVVEAPPAVDANAVIDAFYQMKPGQISDIQLRQLADLPSGHERIEALNLKGTNVSGLGYAVLKKFPNLKSLNIIGRYCKDDVCAYLGDLTSLEELRIKTDNSPTDASVPEFNKVTKLRVFQYHDSQFTPAGWKSFLEAHPDLEVLDVDGSAGLTDPTGEALGKLSKLRELSMWNSAMTDKGMAKWTGLMALERLNLSQAQVQGAGLLTATQAGALLELRDLDMSYTLLNEKGAQAISSMGKLRKLSIAGSNAQDRHLGFLSKLTELEWLSLAGCGQMTDKAVLPLVKLPRLQYLSLGSNQGITNNCMKPLSMMPALQEVEIKQTNVSADQVEKLRALRPELTIRH